VKNAQPAITASPRHVSHELRIHITVPAWFLTVIVVRRRTSGIPLMEVLGWWLTLSGDPRGYRYRPIASFARTSWIAPSRES